MTPRASIDPVGAVPQDTTQAGNCVYAIYTLAKFVYDKQQCGGGAGGAAALAADGQHSQALIKFLRVLLDKLLFKDVGVRLLLSPSFILLRRCWRRFTLVAFRSSLWTPLPTWRWLSSSATVRSLPPPSAALSSADR